MLLKKGVYPYDYMNSFDRFNEQELPTQDKFYSKLNDSKITNKDYEYAQRVWNKFMIGDMGQYTDLYMMTDICLLADVFEDFRSQ